MASEEAFNYHSGLPLLLAKLFWAECAPSSEMIALKIVKWKIPWKTIDFDLVKDAN